MIDSRLCRYKLPDGADEVQKLLQKDKTAHITIAFTPSDEMLENMSHTATALEIPQTGTRKGSGRQSRDVKPGTTAEVATERHTVDQRESRDSDYVCLMRRRILGDNSDGRSSLVLHIDYGASNHMTFD
eukprot:IDg17229t1